MNVLFEFNNKVKMKESKMTEAGYPVSVLYKKVQQYDFAVAGDITNIIVFEYLINLIGFWEKRGSLDCYCSLDTICKKTYLKKATVKSAIKHWHTLGVLHHERREPTYYTYYKINYTGLLKLVPKLYVATKDTDKTAIMKVIVQRIKRRRELQKITSESH